MNQKQLHRRLAGFYFVYFLMLGGVAPYFGLYLRKLGFTAVEIGTLLALMPLARVFAPTAWAWIADHQGKRRPLVRMTTAAAALACAGLLAGNSFAWLFVVILVMNIFWCAALPLVEATTMGHLKGRLGDYGRIRVWGSVSFVISVVVLGQLLDRTGILSLPWMLVLLFALCAGAAWMLPVDQAPPHSDDHLPLQQTLRKPEVVALFIGCFLMSVAHGPYNTFYSILLVEHDYSKSAVGWLWAVSVIAEVVVFMLMPRLMQRYSIPSIISFSLGCAVVRFLLIGWLPDNLPCMVLAQLMHAATFGAHHAAALAAIHHAFRGRTQARGQALYTSLGFGAGGAVGGFASGWLWDNAGPALTFTFAAAAALLALFAIAGRLRSFAVSHSTA